MRRDCSVKIRYALIIVGYFASAGFAYADVITQPVGGGSGGTDSSSANYSMKAAAADPGVGQSQSANYIYDHGTLWEGDASAPPAEPGVGGDSGGGSGSGWDESPLTPQESEAVEAIVEAVKAISVPATGSVPEERFAETVRKALAQATPMPRVIVSVNPESGVQKVAVILARKAWPWPLWLALASIVIGLMTFVLLMAGVLAGPRVLWTGVLLVVLGVAIGLVARSYYRSAYRAMDATAIVDERTVSSAEIGGAVKEVMENLPVGGHRLTVLGDALLPQMTITVYVKQVVPI